jgi:cellulose synthase (UDP-forming)
MAASDPLANAGRLFFGPLQQGRDGLGAVCCCGTNVIFRRDHLVAIGGQAYHCITEVSGQHALAAHGVMGGEKLSGVRRHDLRIRETHLGLLFAWPQDNYTSQRLAGSGFTNMYLNQRLAYGLAPDDLEGVFEQKLRCECDTFLACGHGQLRMQTSIEGCLVHACMICWGGWTAS